MQLPLEGSLRCWRGSSLCSHFMQHHSLKNTLCLALLFNLLSIPAKIADGLASRLNVWVARGLYALTLASLGCSTCTPSGRQQGVSIPFASCNPLRVYVLKNFTTLHLNSASHLLVPALLLQSWLDVVICPAAQDGLPEALKFKTSATNEFCI